ncbi:type IV secretion system protein TraC [Noviherbaspirillum pedocola]|uniref:Type IV secretion system protein TraC n=1 Tax=Noviherbaspirillum pedocola TaxID=2801341 RepID=A0A934W9A2_9BURK|nr:type IV secretion system protein TraC [Noviherbaspirillum pedocola]MBK4737833.1 type IV secretion system protein TraC [Noviherbaspirillum pedocola]
MFSLFKSSKTAKQPILIDGDRKSVPFEKLTVRACDTDSKIFYMSDGKEFYLGACYTGLPITGADAATVDKFKSALSMQLPAGSFVQFALLSSPDVEDYLGQYLSNKEQATPILTELAASHAAHYRAGTEKPLVSTSGILLNRQRILLTIKIPCQNPMPTDVDLYAAREVTDRMFEAIKATGIALSMMDAEQYLHVMRLITHLWDRPTDHYDDAVPLREQIFQPADSVNFSDKSCISFHDGDFHAKAMSVKFFPKRARLSVMNSIIGDPQGLSNQITDPYYMVMTLHYPDQVAKAEWVKSRSAMINHQVFGPTAHMIPILGYKKAGIDTLVHEMEGRGGILCEVNFTVFLFSKTKERLNKLAAGLQAYYSSIGFEMREDKRILEPLWYNLLPMNTTREGIKNLFRFHTMAISHAVQFLPVFGEWTGTGISGAMLMMSRRGQPVLFDLFDSQTNFNAVVIAESGAGKSFFIQQLITDYLAEGAKIWAIDTGRSLQKTADANNGTFIEFGTESNICLNPFTHIDGNLDEEMDILKAMIAKMAAPEEVLDDYRMALLEQAITTTYKKYGNASTVTAVAECCIQSPDPEAQRLGKQLFPFAGGAYTRWFDGENNLNMDNAFVVLELQELKSKKALQQVILLQLMARINHEIFLTHGRRKILILEEAWESLNDPVMGKAMEAVYRKARKHDAAVIVVTQSVADLYGSPNTRAIYQNSAWQLILKQKSESIDSAIEGKQFKIDTYGAYMLKSIHTNSGKYSEVMIKQSESDWGIARMVVSPFSQVLFSTKGAERDVILDAMKRGESAVDAVNAYLQQREAA